MAKHKVFLVGVNTHRHGYIQQVVVSADSKDQAVARIKQLCQYVVDNIDNNLLIVEKAVLQSNVEWYDAQEVPHMSSDLCGVVFGLTGYVNKFSLILDMEKTPDE